MDELEAHRAKYRDKEIQALTDSVRDLAVLFKELSTLVIEQGTIIDRIDYNIETALEDTKKGKKHLEGARKAQKSNRSRKVIIWLSILILMFIVLLIQIAIVFHINSIKENKYFFANIFSFSLSTEKGITNH